MSLRVTTSHVEQDIVVLHLWGSLTTGPETNALESLLSDLLDQQTRKLVFDLSGVDEIESDGTVFLVRCYFRVRSAGGRLRFAGASELVIRPFHTAMLDSLLPFDPTVAVACERFVARANGGSHPT